MSTDKCSLWTFDKFKTNENIGKIDVLIDEKKLGQWEEIFGESNKDIPDGLLVSAMMEGFIKAMQPRPKGNIHVSQMLSFTGQRPRLGDVVSVELSCAKKEIKRQRNWVWFDVLIRNDGLVSMKGQICTIWAE